MKKHELILKELKRRRNHNITYCNINSCEPTPYMYGANNVIDDMINFIEKL